jgi:hypothetical protein
MALENTENPLHIPALAKVLDPVECDYLDVSREEGDRLRLPHPSI